MDELDADGLALVLKNHLPQNIVNHLKDQLVTGACFMSLNESTLKLFNFPLGHIFSIMKDISEIKAGTRCILLEKNISPEVGLNRNFQISRQKNKDQGSCEISENNSGDSDSDTDMILSEFIDEGYLQQMEPYLKRNLRGKVERWKDLIKLKMPHSSAPNLLIPKKYLKSEQQSKGIEDNEMAFSKSTKVASQSKTLTTKPLQKKKQVASDMFSSDEEMLDSACEDLFGGKDSLRTEEQTASKSRVRDSFQISSRSQKRAQSKSDSSFDLAEVDSESRYEGRCETRSVKVTTFNPPTLLRTSDELKNISPSLPSFDIECVLLDDENTKERTKHLVPLLQGGKLLGSKERKRFFRKLVHYLCFKYVDDPSKATAAMREGLAKSIVVNYPSIRRPYVKGQTPWSYIWNKNGGHISNVIKRIQTALPDSKRAKKGKVVKRKIAKKKSTSCNVDIKQLALLMPDRTNREEIFDGMQKSFPLRCDARDKGSSIEEILSDFPHLLSYSGELIAAEYKNMHPNSKDMCPDMAKFVPKVIKSWDDGTIDVTCIDDNVKACLILASKLPHKISNRNISTIPVEEEIIIVVKSGVDLEEFVESRSAGKKKPIQPYLIGVTGQATKEILRYFLVLDRKLLELGRIPFLRCVDWLFKTYVIFNVHYPSTWAQFFRFLQTCFYKIYFSAKDDIPPSSLDLYNKMLAL